MQNRPLESNNCYLHPLQVVVNWPLLLRRALLHVLEQNRLLLLHVHLRRLLLPTALRGTPLGFRGPLRDPRRPLGRLRRGSLGGGPEVVHRLQVGQLDGVAGLLREHEPGVEDVLVGDGVGEQPGDVLVLLLFILAVEGVVLEDLVVGVALAVLEVPAEVRRDGTILR